MTSAALTINLSSNLTKNVTGALPELSNVFFGFFLAIIVPEIMTDFPKETPIFGILTFDDLW